MATRYQTYVVPALGGGLNFRGHPSALRDDEWTDADGWIARLGYAETLPRFVQAVSAAQFTGTTATDRPIGIVQWPFTDDPGAFVAFVNEVTLLAKLYTARDNGTVTQLTKLSVEDVSGNPDAVLQLAYLNSEFMVTLGNMGGTGFAIAKLASLPGYSALVPLGGLATLRPYFLSSFAGHLIASFIDQDQPGWRTVRVSDQGLEDIWVPAIGNSADTFQIDHGLSGITAQVPITPNQLALFTREAVYVMSPTGSFPPFTLELAARPGCMDQRPAYTFPPGTMRHGQLCGIGAAGVIYRGHNNVYLLGRGPVGTKLADYIRANDLAAGPLTVGRAATPFSWDELRQVYWIGTAPRAGASTNELLAYDPATDAWSRRTLPATFDFIRQGYLWDNATAASNNRRYGRLWLLARSREAYVEDVVSVGRVHVGNYLQSKDFSFGDPPRRVQIDRVKVDWEGLESANDTLDVKVWARDDWPNKGTIGGASGLPPAGPFATVGTLGGAANVGQSEVATRLFGKFIRFRFESPNALARVRGFSFRWRFVGNRIAP